MVKPTSRERPVYSIRLGMAERRLLEAAAVRKDEYLAEFIRRSALLAARHLVEAADPTETPV